jgi:hypothetical protein
MALAEPVAGRPIPDVVTLQSLSSREDVAGMAIAPAPAPTARVIERFERINYAKRADRVVIRHGRGRVVAIIEIVTYDEAWRVYPAILKEILGTPG